jgi:ferritin-like metal-binding protein YciE
MPARESLDDLLLQEMRDLLDGETQLTKALPKMAKAADAAPLRAAFEQHLRETEGQIERLNQAFELLDETPKRKTCHGIKGLVDEAKELMDELDGSVLDAALIGAAQKVEHYEIAAYGTLRTFATRLGQSDVAALFEATLNEEKAADEKLTTIAESMVNEEAAEGEDASDEDRDALTGRVARAIGATAGRASAFARQAANAVGATNTRSSRGRKARKSSSGSRSRSSSKAGSRSSGRSSRKK